MTRKLRPLFSYRVDFFAMTTPNEQLAARTELLESMRAVADAKTTPQIAELLGVPVRDVIFFRSVAGVKPAFRSPGGQAYFSAADVEAIRQAAAKHGPLAWKSADGPDDGSDMPASPESLLIDALCGKIMDGARAGHLDPISEQILQIDLGGTS
jgi:hypothetical protein